MVDGDLCHLADSLSWKWVDHLWPDFGSEEKNIRLALSIDEINPYSKMNSKYNCWPVILTTYNLPPWLCMRRKFMMLTMLISRLKQPEYNIDVYLTPLIDDLKILWTDGVPCYDGCSFGFIIRIKLSFLACCTKIDLSFSYKDASRITQV